MTWLDWKLRFYAQELLNWLGLKFGLTRRPIVQNGYAAHLCSILYLMAVATTTLPWWAWIFLPFAILFYGAIWAVAIANLRKTNGHDENWELLRTWRWMFLLFLLLDIFLLVVHVIGGTPATILMEIIELGGSLGFLLACYVASCIEAPPKRKTEARRLATQGA